MHPGHGQVWIQQKRGGGGVVLEREVIDGHKTKRKGYQDYGAGA
jgi:hypothetical protein